MTAAELDDARARLGLSQAGLARVLGLSWSTVHRWHTGQLPVHPTAAAYLAHLIAEKEGKP